MQDKVQTTEVQGALKETAWGVRAPGFEELTMEEALGKESKKMSPEAYYGSHLPELEAAKQQVCDLIERYMNSCPHDDDLKPVVYYTARIKSPESLVEKIMRKGGTDTSFEAAQSLDIHDIVGTRIICAFVDDVYETARWLEALPEVEVLECKDYIENPKPNGYRSLHLILKFNQGPAASLKAIEVQMRTIGIDFWATLEHKIKYKKSVQNPELMQRELKRCADEIASVDISMQAIRNVIRDSDE